MRTPTAVRRDCWEAVRASEVEMVTCEQLLAEVERALAGKYFTLRVTAEERIAYVSLIRTIGAAEPDPLDPPPVLGDPGDDYLVALAASSRAGAIVTGDGDLLGHPGLQPPAVTVREACRRLGIDDCAPPGSWRDWRAAIASVFQRSPEPLSRWRDDGPGAASSRSSDGAGRSAPYG